jgi:hypothetical protein
VWTRLCETRAWIGPVQVRRGPDRVRQDSTRPRPAHRGQCPTAEPDDHRSHHHSPVASSPPRTYFAHNRHYALYAQDGGEVRIFGGVGPHRRREGRAGSGAQLREVPVASASPASRRPSRGPGSAGRAGGRAGATPDLAAQPPAGAIVAERLRARAADVSNTRLGVRPRNKRAATAAHEVPTSLSSGRSVGTFAEQWQLR